MEALQISFPLPLNIQRTCPSPVPLLSPEPRSHLTSAAYLSVQDSNADFQGNDLDFQG